MYIDEWQRNLNLYVNTEVKPPEILCFVYFGGLIVWLLKFHFSFIFNWKIAQEICILVWSGNDLQVFDASFCKYEASLLSIWSGEKRHREK